MRWFVKGDIDGFFGLALDNLIQILLIIGLCTYVLEFPTSLIFGRILPGVVVSMLVGNLLYSYQAIQLGKKLGRNDICALPYGINTPSVFIYIFLVMLPVKLKAKENGLSSEQASHLAWQVGLVACLGSGLIEFAGSFIAEKIRKLAPRAALLSTLSGIALGFISMPFLFRTYNAPIVGLSTLAIILLVYFGKVQFKGKIPGGLVAVVIGTLLSFLTGVAPVGTAPTSFVHFYFPIPVISDLIRALSNPTFFPYLTIIFAMGLFNVLGSLQNIESAEAAGDPFPTKPALITDGLGTIAASLFGSCFPTTIYIGHPGWKALGSGAGYSILNAIFITLICLTGTVAWVAWAIPIEAGMAIVLWIGIVITAQSFQSVPKKHAPAVVIGIMVGVAAWGAVLLKTGIRVTNQVSGGLLNLNESSQSLIKTFNSYEVFVQGLFALEQGCIFSAMILSAITVYVIEQKFFQAAAWCLVAAILSGIGLMHSFIWTQGDTVLKLGFEWRWSSAYLLMALIFVAANWLTINNELSKKT